MICIPEILISEKMLDYLKLLGVFRVLADEFVSITSQKSLIPRVSDSLMNNKKKPCLSR